ncbi:benzoate/H(+) symporter BenE family transporter [Oerskovia sp. M15]
MDHPTLDLGAVVGISVPLLLVTLSAQNGPGLEMLRASGYRPNSRLLVGATAATWAFLAPFGAHGINLAAITAGICTGPEAHEDRTRRYVAGVACGVGYLVVGTFAGSLVGLFHAVPTALVTTVAGIALVGALTSALAGTFARLPRVRRPALPATLEAAVLTLVVTASGVVLAQVGSAFWGIVVGLVAYGVLTVGRRRVAR